MNARCQAEDIVGKIGEWISEHLSEHALAVLVLVTILIVVMIIGGGASSGHLISNLFGDSAIASSYTAEDDDIKTVNKDYKDLEADIQNTVDSIESIIRAMTSTAIRFQKSAMIHMNLPPC